MVDFILNLSTIGNMLQRLGFVTFYLYYLSLVQFSMKKICLTSHMKALSCAHYLCFVCFIFSRMYDCNLQAKVVGFRSVNVTWNNPPVNPSWSTLSVKIQGFTSYQRTKQTIPPSFYYFYARELEDQETFFKVETVSLWYFSRHIWFNQTLVHTLQC